MSIPVENKGKHAITKDIVDQSFYSKKVKLGDAGFNGAVIYTEPLLDFNPEVRPFLNPTLGNAMNQNVSFGGTPELIFDGGSGGTEWVGSGDSEWDFADGGKVVLDHGADNSQALFSSVGNIDTSNYSVLTGKVDLDNYTPSTQSLQLVFRNAGVVVGNSLLLDDFIDTSNFDEQPFVIPLSNFGLSVGTVNEFTITVNRSAGHNPHVSFDDFQIEESGTPLVFKFQPPRGEKFHVNELQINIANNIPSTVTDGTMNGLSHDSWLGINLPSGLGFSARQDSKTTFSLVFRDLGDLLSVGTFIQNKISDGTNTFITVIVPFTTAGILDGNKEDSLSFTVNDDMSSLLRFTIIARGGRLLNESGS